MRDLGKTIICMGKEPTHGAMAESTKENTLWTKSTDTECITGLMEGDMKGFGEMVSSTAKESIFCLTELQRLGSGKMESE